VSTADGCAVLTIRDDGPGIPTAERPRAFERFYRIPGSATGGSGLGLSIVGRVVELLRGDIQLSQPVAGSGLIVTVRLPFADLHTQGRTAA
jgi:signal transduction histidine kinase